MIDLTGQRFNRLTAIAPAGKADKSAGGGVPWHCKCDCGNATIVRSRPLRKGETKSCGCLSRPHGMTKSPTHQSWVAMKTRCSYAKHPKFYLYGGRGVTVCERWLGKHGFQNFIADVGERPPGTSLDRIDPNGNYEPGNVRWASILEQRQNRRRVVVTEEMVVDIRRRYALGEAQNLIAHYHGISDAAVHKIVHRMSWRHIP